LGALQISSARKGIGTVTDADLAEFAQGRIPTDAKTSTAAYGPFIGLSAEYVKEGSLWREWWLRCGHLMIYATYNAPREQGNETTQDVDRILNTLMPLD
jgi:hypothetical protein